MEASRVGTSPTAGGVDPDAPRADAGRWRRIAEGLGEVLAAINAHQSLEAVLDLVVQRAGEVLGADASALFRLQDDGRTLRVVASWGIERWYTDAIRVRLGKGSVGIAVQSRAPAIVTDLRAALASDPDFAFAPEHTALGWRLADHYRALLSVPLVVQDRAFGAISLYYREPPRFSGDEVSLAVSFADQAALAIENARLRAEAEQRLRELDALYRADERLHRSLRIEEVLQALVDVANDLMQADKTALLVWNEDRDRLVLGAHRGMVGGHLGDASFAPGEGNVGHVAATGEPVVIEDLLNDPRAYRRVVEEEGVRSCMHVPIRLKDQLFGVFNVNYVKQRSFGPNDLRLMVGLAQRAALAIENARLYEQSERRARELEALYRADEVLYRSLHVPDVLQAFVEVAASMLGADKTSVVVWDDEKQRLVIGAMHGFEPTMARLSLRRDEGIAGLVATTQQAIVIEDAAADPRVIRYIVEDEGVRSLMAIPIMVGDELFGVFGVNYCREHRFTAEEQRLVFGLAQRTGLAVHNARLYGRAQEVAALHERQRLARDLHDAVTQTLFATTLIGDVLPRLWERNPEQGRARLAELRQLTRGALAEMRALLLELRPGALIEVPLSELLQQLADAFTGRTRVPVDLTIECRCSLPPEVQTALYRIAQEALSNVTRHAGARRVELGLRGDAAAVELSVVDDGRGFEPSAVPPGHMGLGIMRERVAAIGAAIEVASRPGQGTALRVRWTTPAR